MPTLVDLERTLPPWLRSRLEDASSGDLMAIKQAIEDAFAEREMVEEMVSYRKNVTGIDHTVFISPKGYVTHGPRIKVAIDPPDGLNPSAEVASISITDGSVVAGSVDPALLAQVRQFIERNRETLLAYWDYRIDTDELRKGLRKIES